MVKYSGSHLLILTYLVVRESFLETLHNRVADLLTDDVVEEPICFRRETNSLYIDVKLLENVGGLLIITKSIINKIV